MMELVYSEEQYFGSKFLLVILILFELFFVVIFMLAFNSGKITSFFSFLIPGILSLIPLAFLILSYKVKLITKITSEGILIKWDPLQKEGKQIVWKEIRSYRIVKYRFLGYGWRFSQKYGTVFNVRGNTALSIILKNGEKFLVGTQHGQILYEKVDTCIEKFKSI